MEKCLGSGVKKGRVWSPETDKCFPFALAIIGLDDDDRYLAGMTCEYQSMVDKPK